MSASLCHHIKDDGTACGAFAMSGNEFCYFHNPSISDQERKDMQSKGGANRALIIGDPLPEIRIESPGDTVTLLSDTIKRVRAGQIDVKIANCIGVLSGHLIKAFEVAQLGERVEYIERLVLEKREITTPRGCHR